MIVKTFLTSLFVAILFSSCDPNADKQVGNASRFNNTNTSSGTGSTGSTGTPTDAPIDGGLSILLLAGTVYGVKRVKAAKQQKDK